MPVPRPLSPAERTDYQACFPLLDATLVVVTGEIDFAYNCLAWSLGLTNVWPWPGNTLADFDNLYALNGFVRAEHGTVAAYGVSQNEMTHSTVSGFSHGPRWESKWGSDLRFQHDLGELESSKAGSVLAQYRKPESIDEPQAFRKYVERIAKGKAVKTYLTRDQSDALEREIGRLPANLRANYLTAFERWKATWFRGGMRFSSNPTDRRIGAEFDALIALGPTTLPMIVASLADPANFFALQLYDSLQSDPNRRVHYDSNDERVMEGEQGRARRTVQVWFTNR